MVSMAVCLFETVATIETMFQVTQQYALLLDKTVINTTPVNDKTGTDKKNTSGGMHRAPIHHYARHGLCRTFNGKKKLYKALKFKFCRTKISYTASFVIELCRRRDGMLDELVRELFDVDGDGYVTHYEKQLYDAVK
ncbi:uncharacterized protein LOC132726245 [Ruditapes philippinarum]|uniref:uncharacterized protein LOC132726245 n=1 Tax=Ruditapes philippinarum TaxID=129788 RepID=UPI00295BEA13|nr:uncharacterized protein LOC132726245 [Ruditapes philippinarum]XP_060567504.1 uncharacterized protein LOC132726245 [Ruditapes philippinarum]XP_060567505.1 uncharacterized protein LOC132726245 [Ruditapes philippinarum]